VPLHFKAASVTLQPGEKSCVSAPTASSTRSRDRARVALDGEAKMLNAGEGLFIAGGKTAALTAGSGGHRLSSTSSLPPPPTWIGRLKTPACHGERIIFAQLAPIPT